MKKITGVLFTQMLTLYNWWRAGESTKIILQENIISHKKYCIFFPQRAVNTNLAAGTLPERRPWAGAGGVSWDKPCRWQRSGCGRSCSIPAPCPRPARPHRWRRRRARSAGTDPRRGRRTRVHGWRGPAAGRGTAAAGWHSRTGWPPLAPAAPRRTLPWPCPAAARPWPGRAEASADTRRTPGTHQPRVAQRGSQRRHGRSQPRARLCLPAPNGPGRRGSRQVLVPAASRELRSESGKHFQSPQLTCKVGLYSRYPQSSFSPAVFCTAMLLLLPAVLLVQWCNAEVVSGRV